MPAEAVTGLILCGGAGQRMGRVEKPLQLLHGRPLIAHVADRLRPQVGRLLLSANREQAAYAPLADDVIPDAAGYEGMGPLGGVLAASSAIRSPMVFVCPGDAPRIDRSLVARLHAAMTTTPCEAVIPHDGTQPQYLFLLLRLTAIARLPQYLAQQRRSVHGFLEQLSTITIDASNIADSFLNINTPEELSAANRTPYTME